MENVRVEQHGRTTVVTLARPEVRNAVDGETAQQLVDAFGEFDANAESDVAVLYGDNGTFCAGADLKAIAAQQGNRVLPEGDGPMGPTRMELGKPVIAAIAGHAVAGGLELALWCDLRVVERSAILGVYCRRWGVPLVDGGTIRLPRLIGHSRAMDLILTGRGVGAEEALQMGLANRVVDDGQALVAALELAQQLGRFPQTCLRNDRLSANEQWNLSLQDAISNEYRRGIEVIRSRETVEGASRFASGKGRHGDFEQIWPVSRLNTRERGGEVTDMLVEAVDLLDGFPGVVFDCRFSLADPEGGRRRYQEGHVPGAHYLDLNVDLAGSVEKHGGRHPLPEPAAFAATLARFGVGRETGVLAYDDSRLAFASRLWWMMRSLGFRPPRLLNGGYQGYLHVGGKPAADMTTPAPLAPEPVSEFRWSCDIEAVRKASEDGVLLVDSREPARYRGEEEPIDPVAGHIPGAVNRPWQDVTDDRGRVLGLDGQRAHWGDALEAEKILVYCGSGVTACVNLFSLALLGREDATLYTGSWSDWCSYL